MLGKVGLAAQGVCFGIIGALAIALAAGHGGGKATDPQGALDALAAGGWTRVVLVLLCAGFACYTVWRLAQAFLDRGRMGSDFGGLFRRSIQLVQGIAYGFLTFGAAKTVVEGPQRSGGARRAAAGVLGWPAGRELVGFVAVVLLVVGGVLVYWSLSHRFEESLATEDMTDTVRRGTSVAGVVGLLALALVSGVVGWFLMKAAITFDPRAPVGIGGALSKLAQAPYGKAVLACTAAGLIVFAAFDLLQARYHKA
ncbi:MAG TPA: DUF1206 domain-containing protein [Gaiellaceae bacterium]|nr:DUF1206 domain-containing protein [Gaiellaceae bacterium]